MSSVKRVHAPAFRLSLAAGTYGNVFDGFDVTDSLPIPRLTGVFAAMENMFVRHGFSGPTLRCQSRLEVFRINSRLGSLLPSHLRSLRLVHLYELPLCWASGEGEEPSALCARAALERTCDCVGFAGFSVFFAVFPFLFSW